MPYFKKEMKQTIQQTFDKLLNKMYSSIGELSITAYITDEPEAYEKRTTGTKKELKPGDIWGKLFTCGWFNFKGTVPESAKGRKVVLLIDVGGEACVVDDNGSPLRGLTNVKSEYARFLGMPGKRVYSYLDCAQGGEEIDIWAETGCNDLFGNLQDSGAIQCSQIGICNEEIRNLYYDFEVLKILMEQIDEDSARHNSILHVLYKASNLMIDFTEDEATKARAIIKKELDRKAGDTALSISAIGHAHIDLAWLWPIRETIRKGGRTFSTVIDLMDKYDDYVFGASQPQLYEWTKQHYPALYEKIRDKIEEGRWEVQGAMWVEADTNVSGGEALIRQLLYGKRYFRNEFNKDMKVLWLPDVFGYTASLPQILKKSGVDYFMTIKLSWSKQNKFPHHTFRWLGIDGSEVLTHMPPEGNYNSAATPESIRNTEKNFIDKGVSNECLMLFGIGDGGGGPGAEHLERLQREKNLEGLMPVNQEASIEFFERINKNRDDYEKWIGELYLECHQGTYTTQADNKKYNRHMELLLRDTELFAYLAYMFADENYPQQELETIWKEVLLYQFHDILPGSSIKRVYDESVERYKVLFDDTKDLKNNAIQKLLQSIGVKNENSYVLFNTLSWVRNEWIKLEDKWVNANVPSIGYSVIDIDEIDLKEKFAVSAANNIIENELIKVEFGENGFIKSIFDKEESRETLDTTQSSNVLNVYKDNGDAWDFAIGYRDTVPEAFKLVDRSYDIDGPKASIVQKFEYNKSTIYQTVVVTEGSKKIDFDTKVDWNEDNKMLRTSFGVNVFAQTATCDIQFGTIDRPCHDNTGWDKAKYEICAHKWVDVSQRDYGVALLNNSKYGHYVNGNTIDLNILRSPDYPGKNVDRGVHEFVYSILPHTGNHIEGDVAKEAYQLNVPLTTIKGEASDINEPQKQRSFIEVADDNIVIEAVKKAEDSDDMIIRLYENSGSSCKTNVNFGFDIKSATLVNMLEEDECELKVCDNSIDIEFKPFEIHSIKIVK